MCRFKYLPLQSKCRSVPSLQIIPSGCSFLVNLLPSSSPWYPLICFFNPYNFAFTKFKLVKIKKSLKYNLLVALATFHVLHSHGG